MEFVSASIPSAEPQRVARQTQVVWPRFLAFVSDSIIISVLLNAVNNVFGITTVLARTSSTSYSSTVYIPWGTVTWGNFSLNIVEVGIIFLYFTVQEALFGATIGKAY